MAFKGGVSSGKEIVAKLDLHDASGEAHLILTAGQSGRTPLIDSSIAPPPTGFATAKVAPKAKGVLELIVDMANQSDTGTLTLSVGGEVETQETITGDQFWSYSIFPPKAGR